MACQRCGSKNVVSISAHHSDCFNMTNHATGKEIDGYAPRIPDICGGDDTFPKICFDCGQVQGKFPKEFPQTEDE